MSEPGFTASNGWRVNNDVEMLMSAGGIAVLNERETREAREFFLEERDHTLGRWRDPEAPHMVCYPVYGDDVRVIDERDGTQIILVSEDVEGAHVSGIGLTAVRYFAAHPVKTIPTMNGIYVRRIDAGNSASDLYHLSPSGKWETDHTGTWDFIDPSNLPDDLVRLVPEEAK